MSKYAQRIENMQESAYIVRSLFGSMVNKDVISFGGGAPANEALPIEILNEITHDILNRNSRGIEALAYGPVDGVADLRQVICDQLLIPKGVKAEPDNILITNGGMEVMNLVGQLYLNAKDIVLVESPTFVQSILSFEMFEAKCVPVDVDEDGMIIDDLEKKIAEYNPKLIYVIPTFQNPSGRTLSLERRKKIAKLAMKHDIIVLEDDPYRDIRFIGEELAPIKTFDESEKVILGNSFSKIFSPGVRLGYVVANKEIIKEFWNIKLATNSHTSIFPQVLAAEFFKRGYYPEHHKMLCDLYRERRNAMCDSIDEFFPVGTKRTSPEGGLFCWVELPEHINTSEFLEEAKDREDIRVAFLPGEKFFPKDFEIKKNCMRLSYGNVPADKIKEGIKRLAKLINEKV